MKLLVICCVVAFALCVCAQERVLLEAGGTKDWSMFPVIKSDTIYCAPKGNILQIGKGKTSTRGWFWLTPTEFNGANDYRIEAKLRQTDGDIYNGFGVIYGFKDPDNYACFMISSWRQAKLASMDNGKWFDWRDMLQLKPVKPMGEWNTIALEKLGNKVRLIINDTLLVTTDAPRTYGSGIGFIAHSILSFEVEYLRLVEAPPGELKAVTAIASTSTLPNATMRFHNILFDRGKSEIRPSSLGELNQVVGFLRSNSVVTIEISGHTDSTGSEALNLRLSEERARSIMRYLVTKGISSNRITAVGYGEARPITANNTESGRQQNRRVEFKMGTR